jgi:hypothetical protein
MGVVGGVSLPRVWREGERGIDYDHDYELRLREETVSRESKSL